MNSLIPFLRIYPWLAALCCLALTACDAGGGTLSFTPAALKDCGPADSAAVVEVHWDAGRAAPEDGVMLWVNRNGKSRYTGFVQGPPGKSWMKGAAAGSAATGPWAVPGMLVVMTDAHSGKVLAKKKIPATACD